MCAMLVSSISRSGRARSHSHPGTSATPPHKHHVVFTPANLVWTASYNELGTTAAAHLYPHALAAQSCAAQPIINTPSTLAQPVWSPDGWRLLLLHGDVANVLSTTTGKARFSLHIDGSEQFVPSAWTSHSKQVVTSEAVAFLSRTLTSERIRVGDAQNGGLGLRSCHRGITAGLGLSFRMALIDRTP